MVYNSLTVKCSSVSIMCPNCCGRSFESPTVYAVVNSIIGVALIWHVFIYRFSWGMSFFGRSGFGVWPMRIEIACIDAGVLKKWRTHRVEGTEQHHFAEVWIELYQVLLRWNPQGMQGGMPGTWQHFLSSS